MFSKLKASIIEFMREARAELHKVSFPSRTETMGSTTVVIVFCIIMSVYLSVVDAFLVWLVSKVI